MGSGDTRLCCVCLVVERLDYPQFYVSQFCITPMMRLIIVAAMAPAVAEATQGLLGFLELPVANGDLCGFSINFCSIDGNSQGNGGSVKRVVEYEFFRFHGFILWCGW